ncbi:MAG: M3 family oligoendopeptidase [Anaerolineae bacterium]|jgi:oligoendopeptidase F|nr:M3 family oligoendopeptidase [Anaerolineae bacterium]
MTQKTFEQTRWDLKDLFPGSDSAEFEAAFAELETLVTDFEKVREQLDEEMNTDEFMEIVSQVDRINRVAHKMYAFVQLWYTEDTQNEKAMAAMGRVDQFVTDLSNRTLFFNLWWKKISDMTAKRLMADSGDYKYWLEQIRNFKDYTLSEAEEKIINLKDMSGFTALNNVYDTMTNRYTFKLEVDGEEKELTRGQLMVHVRSTDADLRQRAYAELYRVYGNDGLILGQIYQAIVRDWYNENITLRGIKTPMSVRNLRNDIPDDVVDTLVEVTRKNVDVFQRFFKLKAKTIGMDKLRRCDIYAGVGESDKEYDFNTAFEMVMESFESFTPKFAELAKRVFVENHIDSEVRKGKMGGAFCASTVPELTPWVLLNYQGKADDVSTMAHELGHAIHAMMAADHTVFTFHSCLPLAETASTFGEMMLIDKILAEETDEAVIRDILFRQVDDNYATIMRQMYFAIFERTAHKMVLENASVKDMAEAYLENLKEMFGDAVEVTDEFKWEWVSIPHIYGTPFYVYAYAFGQLLVLALYQQFKLEGESFKPRFMEILAAGGSKAPAEIISEAGFDFTDPAFWQGGYDVISNMVDELEKLA